MTKTTMKISKKTLKALEKVRDKNQLASLDAAVMALLGLINTEIK